MADTVTSKVIYDGAYYYTIQLTCLSDGTGESAVTKVGISTLTTPDGTPCTRTTIVGLVWNIGGFTSIRLFWDRTTDVTIARMSGAMGIDYGAMGGLADTTTGDTGDILLTSSGAVFGAAYTIDIILRKLP